MINRTLPLVLVTLFLLGAYGCDAAKDDGSESQRKEESRRKEVSFAAKYNAVTDWMDPEAMQFTLALQNALLRPDKRPVLERSCELMDVRREAQDHIAEFVSDDHLSCRWQLRCSNEQALKLIGKSEELDTYLIIAQVSSVERGPAAGETLIKGQLVDYLKE